MRALVTGATGFLGAEVVAELLRRGVTVRCLLRPSSRDAGLEAAARGRVEIVRGHLSRPEVCDRALAGCDTVYHVAAEMAGGAAVLFLGNVVATRVLAEAALRAKVRRF